MTPASGSLVLFRVDASGRTGVGHLMRCLALAHELRDAGWQTRFVMQSLPQTFVHLLDGQDLSSLDVSVADTSSNEAEDAGQVASLAHCLGASWVVVDHYGLGVSWEQFLREAGLRVLAIDDLARWHDCDILLDQNYYLDSVDRYVGKVRSESRLLLGPRYALLRHQFLKAAERAWVRSGKVQSLLVSFGGSDPSNETEKVLEALSRSSTIGFKVTVVKKLEYLSRAERALAGRRSMRLLDWVDDMAELMLASDLGFGAGGSSVWERCYVGLPSSIVIVAPNQRESMEDVATFGALRVLGHAGEIGVEDWKQEIDFLMSRPEVICAMSRRAVELMDRKGTVGPRAVVAAMEEAD